MSEALLEWPTFNMFPSRSQSKPRVLPWRRVARQAGRVASGVGAAMGFAAVMWLLLAGPGFVTDHAAHPQPSRMVRR